MITISQNKPFVVYEGADATGKTANSEKLAHRVNGKDPFRTSFWRIPVGYNPEQTYQHTPPFDHYYKLVEDRVPKIIENLLPEHAIVLNRWGESLEIMHQLYTGKERKIQVELPTPDLLVYTTVEWDVARERLQDRENRGFRLEMHERDESMYRDLTQLFEERMKQIPDVFHLDTTHSPLEQSIQTVLTELERRKEI